MSRRKAAVVGMVVTGPFGSAPAGAPRRQSGRATHASLRGVNEMAVPCEAGVKSALYAKRGHHRSTVPSLEWSLCTYLTVKVVLLEIFGLPL